MTPMWKALCPHWTLVNAPPPPPPGVAGSPSPTPGSSLTWTPAPPGSSGSTSMFWSVDSTCVVCIMWLHMTSQAQRRSSLIGRHIIPCVLSSLHGKSSSTGNLLERDGVPVPDYSAHSRMAAPSRQQRPYIVAVPGFSQVHTHTHPPPPHLEHVGGA